jgi:hypothetical protein
VFIVDWNRERKKKKTIDNISVSNSYSNPAVYPHDPVYADEIKSFNEERDPL